MSDLDGSAFPLSTDQKDFCQFLQVLRELLAVLNQFSVSRSLSNGKGPLQREMKTIWDILGSEAEFNGKVVASILQKLLQVEVWIGKILWIQWFAGGDQYFGKANVLSNAISKSYSSSRN